MHKKEIDPRHMLIAIIVLGLSLLAGCTVDNMRQGIYEGFRTRNDLQYSPPERAGKPESPDYREYERLRKQSPGG